MLFLPSVFTRVSLQSTQLVCGYDFAFPPGTRVLKLHSTCTPSISQPRHTAPAQLLRRTARSSRWSLSSGTHLVMRSMTASYTAGCSSRQAQYTLSERNMLPQRAAFVIHCGISPSYTYVFNRVSLQSKQLVFRNDNAFPPGTQVLKLHSTCTASISQPLHWL